MPKTKLSRMDRAVRKHFDIPGLAKDLAEAKWRITEGPTEHGSARIDRTVWVGSYRVLEDLARHAVPKKEWREAANEGFEHEIVDEYMEALGDAVGAKMKEHVYGTFEEGEGFVGQYEDGHLEELRKAFVIED